MGYLFLQEQIKDIRHFAAEYDRDDRCANGVA